MRIGDRYIGWQVFYGTFFGVTLLTMVLVLGQIFKAIRPLMVDQGASPLLIGKIILLVLPFSLVFTVPWGFLASTLLSFGRLSSHNELIGWRMAGLSLFRVSLPVLVIAAALSGFCLWLTGTGAPKARDASRELLYNTLLHNPTALLDPGISQSRFKDKKVYVEGRDADGRHRGIHIYELDEETNEPVAYVFADTIDLKVDESVKELRLKLTKTYIETTRADGEVELAFAGQAEPWLINWTDRSNDRKKAGDIANAEIPGEIELTRQMEKELRRQLKNDSLTAKQTKRLKAQIEKEADRSKGLRIEIHSRRSLSMACFSFALIGIPLGISARRKETSTGLLLSLFVAAGYFGFLIFAEQLSDAPLPVIVAVLWLPNVACLVLGTWLFRRASFR